MRLLGRLLQVAGLLIGSLGGLCAGFVVFQAAVALVMELLHRLSGGRWGFSMASGPDAALNMMILVVSLAPVLFGVGLVLLGRAVLRNAPRSDD